MKNSEAKKESGMSIGTVDRITTIFLVFSFALFLYSLDHPIAGVFGKKTTFLQERIDRVIANNR